MAPILYQFKLGMFPWQSWKRKSKQDQFCKCFSNLYLRLISQYHTGMSCGNAQNQSERALQCHLARDIYIVKGKTETNISINLPQN